MTSIHRSTRRSLAVVLALLTLPAGAALAKPPGDFCAMTVDRQPPAQPLGNISAARRKIIATAAAAIGSVKDARGPDGNKQGWQTLVGYYETAFGTPGSVKG